MGFRFRKSIKIAKGLNLNLSKRGVNTSVGVPGSGLWWTTSGERKKRKSQGGGGCGCLLLILVGLIVMANMDRDKPPTLTSVPVPAIVQPTPTLPASRPQAVEPIDQFEQHEQIKGPSPEPIETGTEAGSATSSGHSVEFEENIRKSIERRHARERAQAQAKTRLRAGSMSTQGPKDHVSEVLQSAKKRIDAEKAAEANRLVETAVVQKHTFRRYDKSIQKMLVESEMVWHRPGCYRIRDADPHFETQVIEAREHYKACETCAK